MSPGWLNSVVGVALHENNVFSITHISLGADLLKQEEPIFYFHIKIWCLPAKKCAFVDY